MPSISDYTNLAMQQLLKEQLEKRTTDLDNWLKECDVVWKEKHILLPYPKYPNYPSDDEVLFRAKLLFEIEEQNNKKEIKENVTTDPMVEQTKEENEIIKIDTESEKENLQNTEKIIEKNDKKIPALFRYKRKK